MNALYYIIKADYHQRTRNYSFLIALATTLFIAYSFVPPPDASYTTLTTGAYQGVSNSPWVGHVAAIMTTIVISLYGFLLVNSGIKKDIDTHMGLIIASAPVSNFRYLFSKLLSNFLVLFTIAGCTTAFTIGMFFYRNTGGYSFSISDFLLPFLFLPLPALFMVSALAVVAEVFLSKKNILQYLIFILLFGAATASVNNSPYNDTTIMMDVLGTKTVTNSILNTLNTEFHQNIKTIGVGYISTNKPSKSFEWQGLNWPAVFMLSRVLWIIAGILLVYLSSFFFNRFDVKERISKKQKKKSAREQALKTNLTADINNQWVPDTATKVTQRSLLPAIIPAYGILPFIKIELLLLLRKGPKWFWLINGGIWLSLFFVPLTTAHSYILPVLWFLQVNRLSEITAKEKTHGLHYFTYASYKPLERMLPSQILAALLLMVTLALPVLMRYVLIADSGAIAYILSGAVFIVLLAVCSGIISAGNKFFEIVFFLLTYALLKQVPGSDYLGTVTHSQPVVYITIILLLTAFLGIAGFAARNYQSRHL